MGAAGSRRRNGAPRPDDDGGNFVYAGQKSVPDGVIRVIVHPSDRVIRKMPFVEGQLIGIGVGLGIRARAFLLQIRLIGAELRDGIEAIGREAFCGCMSLREISFPPSVRAINHGAFDGCSELATVILNDGLEVIEKWAFKGCALLVRIDIPPSVGVIEEGAFEYCPMLTTVRFCDEIEEFVSAESMRHWWNRGVHEKCMRTYSFFVRCNIPERVGLLSPRMWRSDIHDMLGGIPSISSEGLDSYFRSVASKLSVYDKLKDAPALLELAIWKSKIIERTDGNIDPLDADMKIECRTDSLPMVAIIVPNVLSFLG